MPSWSKTVEKDPYRLMGLADMARAYPYLEELYKQNPPLIREFPPGARESGYMQGGRETSDPSIPKLVVLDTRRPSYTVPHEYAHWAIDDAPVTWAKFLTPGNKLNIPTPRAKGRMDFLNYPETQATEETLIRSLVPGGRYSEAIHKKPEDYLTPEQLQLLPYLRQYLQYGPSWGSLAGGEKSGVIVDPTYRGTQVENRDGTFSSERTMTFEDKGVHYIIPTLYRGKQLRPEKAFKLFEQGHLPAVGMASTKEEAERMAEARSIMLGEEGRKTRTIQKGQVVPLKEEKESRPMYSPREKAFSYWSEIANLRD